MKNIASIRQALALASEIYNRAIVIDPTFMFSDAYGISHSTFIQLSNRVYGMQMKTASGVDFMVRLQTEYEDGREVVYDALNITVGGQELVFILDKLIDKSQIAMSDVAMPDITTVNATGIMTTITVSSVSPVQNVYVLETELYDLQPAILIDESTEFGQIFVSLENPSSNFVYLRSTQLNENRRVRNKRQTRVTENEISNSRLETLSTNLLDYQSTREIRRKSTSKSDINYLENKITNYLSKINRFVDEFGLDFLKKRLKETYETEIYSTLLDEATEYLKESRINENLNTDVSWGGLDFVALPDEDRHALVEASKEIYRDIQLQNPVLFKADTRYLSNLVGAALAAIYQGIKDETEVYQDSRHSGRIYVDYSGNYVIEIVDNSKTYEYVVPAHITRQIRG
jgi:hypothetical protein